MVRWVFFSSWDVYKNICFFYYLSLDIIPLNFDTERDCHKPFAICLKLYYTSLFRNVNHPKGWDTLHGKLLCRSFLFDFDSIDANKQPHTEVRDCYVKSSERIFAIWHSFLALNLHQHKISPSFQKRMTEIFRLVYSCSNQSAISWISIPS